MRFLSPILAFAIGAAMTSIYANLKGRVPPLRDTSTIMPIHPVVTSPCRYCVNPFAPSLDWGVVAGVPHLWLHGFYCLFSHFDASKEPEKTQRKINRNPTSEKAELGFETSCEEAIRETITRI